jgi:hypothetical protein
VNNAADTLRVEVEHGIEWFDSEEPRFNHWGESVESLKETLAGVWSFTGQIVQRRRTVSDWVVTACGSSGADEDD